MCEYNFEYNFPAVYRTAQANKINEELAKLPSLHDGTQPFDPLDASACMALLGVLQACETMLRMYDQGIVGPCRAVVEARNRARGYYQEPDWRERAEAEIDAILAEEYDGEGGER